MIRTIPTEKLGFVHHMLYPASLSDSKAHADTAIALSQRDDIGAVDLCLPIDETERARAIAAIRGCGKQITYVNHLFPARKISLATADPAERWIAKEFLRREADAAAQIGATQLLFVSGIVPPGSRADAMARFGEMARWLTQDVLRPLGIAGIIEPLDTGIDKRFLMGSTVEGCQLVESLGLPDLFLEIDMGHIPCLFEDFEESYRVAAPYLGRVHLSSCILRDTEDPFFGDRHPSFFHPAGHLHVRDLRNVLRILDGIGYFAPGDERKLLFEVNPLPGECAEECVMSHLKLLQEALLEE